MEKSKQLSKVRIHVERIIGLLKNRFTILKGTLPNSIIKHGMILKKQTLINL